MYFYSYKKYRDLVSISEKLHISAKFQKTEFDEYAISAVAASNITSI